jgi:hypothetical protein
VVSLGLAGTAMAGTYFGKVTAMPHNRVSDGLFRVQIVAVNGQDPGKASHRRVPVGSNTVTLRLVPSRAWGNKLPFVPADLATKDLVVKVNTGLTYHLAARVDLTAPEAAQRDGSFWQPVIADTFRAR